MSSSVCRFYMRGSCRFGNRCWNSHELNLNSIVHINRSFELQLSSDDEDDSPMSAAAEGGSTPMMASPSCSASNKSTQRNKILPNSAQKTSKMNSAASQDKWCLKNNNTGETREGTPDSILLETVKKLNEADNMVKTLRQQLRQQNEGENFSWVQFQIEQGIESDLQCNICYEMFIKPTVLNCSHTFCHECIESWTRRVNHCPTCRVYVKNKAYCLTLDTFLDKVADCLPDEIKTRRETLKVERNNNRAEINRFRRTNTRRRNNRNQSMRQTLGLLWGERDRDGAEWNIALEDALFDPVRLGDVIGRNRDDREDDEWSDSDIESSYEWFCSYCDNMGHSASNCPISIMEETDEIW